MKSRSARTITIGMLLFLSGLLLGGCNDKQKTLIPANIASQKVSIAVSKTPLSAPFFVAQANGYFKQQGLEVTLIDTLGGHRCLDAVLSDEVDMGTASDYPVMIQSFQHKNFAIAATFVTSTNDVKLIANRQRDINKTDDLHNKRIGTVTGASSHFFIDRFLLFNNMTMNDVNVVHINPEDMPQALSSGKVDALSVWEPYGYLTNKLLKENSLIFPAGDYYRETFNLVLKKEYIEKNSDIIKKTLLAINKAINYIKQEPLLAQQITITRLNLDTEFIDWIWQDFHFGLSLDQSLIVTLENEAKWAVENNIVKTSTPPANFLNYVHTDVLKNIDKSSVSIIN